MRVSLVVPTYDKSRYLDYTLASLVHQRFRDFEVIVVDDGGGDGAEQVVDRYREHYALTYLRQDNGGRSAARNLGLAHATGELIVFNDDDRIAHPDLLAEHVRFAREHPDAVAIGWKRRVLTLWEPGRLPTAERDLLTLAARDPELLSRMEAGGFALITPQALLDDFAAAVAVIDLGDEEDNYHAVLERFGPELAGFRFGWALGTTANLAVRAEMLAAVGHFDESFRGWGMEDTELSYRLHAAGARFAVHPAAINYHQVHPIGADSLPRDQRRRRAELLANLREFCRKHPSADAYLFWRRWTYAVTINDANDVLDDLEKLDAHGGSSLRAELERLYRDLLDA
ncbi:glycosyltransferase family 2 protein [Nocardia sp. NPDC127579]|uniref:glycosyltransferase family 2 protein n=1 Tax=Nocardia sp. NPDC127579 TaxID=3345402 RepID=UPI00364115B6